MRSRRCRCLSTNEYARNAFYVFPILPLAGPQHLHPVLSLAAGTPIVGVGVGVHGFIGESSWTVQLTVVHFAKPGFAVATVDHQGHSFFEGLQGHIPPRCSRIARSHLLPFHANYPPPLSCFLHGSLGGAIALLLYQRNKDRWRDGAVLNGAMCGRGILWVGNG
ncbi:hypothetical protein GUJ93_ZPchr0013g36323 [Zizania palustris]|uniref:Serine aminopeptidase S33 domain-containing protein n=1 Tax=Zizania palustris TaxID=103762 RepID=A0A8J5WXQ2_ZIZPA|nr:hypothetical protein GUJ93_ZPchr0013g36323 [Zizania palustris]